MRNQQILVTDAFDGCVFFVEARNYRAIPQFFENCLVGFNDDGVGQLGVTFFIDFDMHIFGNYEIVSHWIVCVSQSWNIV